MKKAIMKIGVAALRLLYAPMKLFKVKNRITFISRQSDKPSTDIVMLCAELERKHPEAHCKVLAKMLKPTPAGLISYSGEILRQMHALATSKVVVIDGYCITACVLSHKKETTLIQIWHSLAAIKKFGYQTLDAPAGHSSKVAEIMQMHRNYDYITCPGELTGKCFCEAMDTDESKMVILGLPRIDIIKRRDAKAAEEIRSHYGIDESKKILLYAPTFRKGKKVKVRELAEAIDREKFELVVKLHPVYKKDGDIPEGIISDDRYTSYEWLNACDGVITDYSAMGIEATLAEKPVYFYLYDLEEYKETIGINVNPLIEMSTASATDAAEMAEIIDGDYDYEELKKFRDKYVTADTTDCTGKMAEFIWKQLRNS